MTFFLDMDGVLVDFISGALGLYGRKYVEELWPAGVRDVVGVVGGTKSEFWGNVEIAEHRDFWSRLAPYPWMREVVDLVDIVSEGEGFCISTSPSKSWRCASQKALWLEKHLKIGPDRYFMGSSKHLLSGPQKVLIDDNEKNCELWEKNKGRSVLFPQPWNSNRRYMKDRMAFLRKSLM